MSGRGEWSTSFLVLQKNGIPLLGVNRGLFIFLFSGFLSSAVLYFLSEKKIKSHMEEEEASLQKCFQFYRLFQKCFFVFLFLLVFAQDSVPFKSLNPPSFCPLIPKVTVYTPLCVLKTL